VAAFYVDRFDRKRVLLFGYMGFLVGTICCGIAPDAWFLMVARILTGLFGGLIGAQVLSIIADVFPYEKRGRAMSSIFMAFAAASVFGVPFSLYLAGIFSWHAPFLFIGLLGWIIVPFIIKYLPRVNKHILETKADTSIMAVFGKIIRNRTQLIALLLAGLLMLGHFMLIPFINPYMEFNKGFTKQETPLIYMVGGICSLLASFVIGRVADDYGKFRVFYVAVLLSLIPMLLITNMPDLPLYLVLSIFGFWFAASTSRGIPAQAMISTVVEPAERGRFMSFNSSFQQLFTGLASIIAGLIVSKGADGKILHYNRVGYLATAIVASTIYLGHLLAKRQQLK
jgi:predicted MFS family arabinose efflux permease